MNSLCARFVALHGATLPMARSLRLAPTMLLSLLLLPACAARSAAQPSTAARDTTEGDSTDGILRFDVVVTDKTGAPVSGLKQEDFTLLDDGREQSLVSFHAYDASEKPDPPSEIILVLDALNLSPQQLTTADREVEHFLQTAGRLDHPTLVYRLSDSGLFASQQSTDGDALARQIADPSALRAVWREPVRLIEPQLTTEYANDRNRSSLKALGAITIEARQRHGHKLLLWIGPGWPVQAGGNSSFDEIVEFSTRLREARVQLDSITAWPAPDGAFMYQKFLTGVRLAKEAVPGNLSLDVLATQSGGVVVPAASHLAMLIRQCIEHVDDFYTLTFDPPPTTRPDDYHAIQVAVNRPNLSVRTNHAYYNEPTFYDQLAAPREPITADNLQQTIASLRSLSDSQAAQHLSTLILTSRLSQAQLDSMLPHLHGRKSREALILLADQSAFLPPPAASIPSTPAPIPSEQQRMLQRTVNYLHTTIPTIPDLFAARTTVQYEERSQQSVSWKLASPDQSLTAAAPESVTVLIRDWKEVTEAPTSHSQSPAASTHSLTTTGTFGPILAIVAVVDAVAPHSRITWSRWELDAAGPRAVFQYIVPQPSSHFQTRFCCLANSGGTVPFNRTSAYHGEITLDPGSGAVLRVTAQADFPPRLPIIRSQMMVEYGAVSIGGQTYVVPLHSVAVSRFRTLKMQHQWNTTFGVYGPFATALNSVTFSRYHLFRSRHRILTDAPSTP